MRPTLHLGMPSGDVRWNALSAPMQGFDSIRLLSQIVSLQCLHYLALAILLPPLLAIFTLNRYALDFQGGVASLSLLLDWREVAGFPILDGGRAWPWNMYKEQTSQHDLDFLRDARLNTSDLADGNGLRFWWEYEAFIHLDSTHFVKVQELGLIAWEGRQLGTGSVMERAEERKEWEKMSQGEYEKLGWWPIFARDRSRGWIIALAWALTGVVDVVLLSTLIRRPTHILDHTITLHVVHLALTWLYTRNFPMSLFYWLVIAAHVGATVVWAEALSIRREMQSGWHSGLESGSVEQARVRRHSRAQSEERSQLLGHQSNEPSGTAVQPHVLFEDDDEDFDDKRADRKINGQGGEAMEMKRFD